MHILGLSGEICKARCFVEQGKYILNNPEVKVFLIVKVY